MTTAIDTADFIASAKKTIDVLSPMLAPAKFNLREYDDAIRVEVHVVCHCGLALDVSTRYDVDRKAYVPRVTITFPSMYVPVPEMAPFLGAADVLHRMAQLIDFAHRDATLNP